MYTHLKSYYICKYLSIELLRNVGQHFTISIYLFGLTICWNGIRNDCQLSTYWQTDVKKSALLEKKFLLLLGEFYN